MSNNFVRLTNVDKFNNLMTHVTHRDPSLPSIVAFYGASGLGKTSSAIFAANMYQARYIQVGESWTKKKLITEIAKQHSIFDVRTVCEGVERIIEVVSQDPKPIIIDEADYLVKGDKIELIREIHDQTRCPIVLIGEGQLSIKLRKFERVHNRVLKWEVAAKASIEDTVLLAGEYCAGIDLTDDLIKALNAASDGITRRIVINLNKIKNVALNNSWSAFDLKKFKTKDDFITALAPIGGRAV